MATYNYTPNAFGQQNGYPNPNYPMQYPQQIGNYPQPASQQAMPPSGYMARLVTCREEAVAAQLFDNNPWVFVDEAHGMVYTKRLNSYTNSADFREYQRVDGIQAQSVPPAQYVTLDMFEALKQEVAALKSAAHTPATRSKASKEADAQ